MHRCDYEWEDVSIKETSARPHCSTCDCQRRGLEVRRTVSRPVHKQSTPCKCRRAPLHAHRHPTSHCGIDNDVCMCYECRKILGISEATVRKKSIFCTHRNALLEQWFTKFDVDGDGYLELEDLEYMMDYLGARCHAKKLLRFCDSDCDGLLSFADFVRLWRQAAVHDEDFLRQTGCRDLPHVVKKYNLYSDAGCSKCLDYHCGHVTFATEYPVQGVKCKCGLDEKILPFVKQESRKKSALKKSSKKMNEADQDNYPIMSCNRENLM